MSPDSLYELAVRLYVAARFDAIRQGLRNDYGCGQRGAELMRLRRRLREANYPELVEIPAGELLSAFEKYAAPKLRRADSQPAGDGTPYTRQAWRILRTRFELEAGIGPAGELSKLGDGNGGAGRVAPAPSPGTEPEPWRSGLLAPVSKPDLDGYSGFAR